MIKRLNLKITGIVQGVGYRYYAQKEAQKRGFTGYVRNTADGGVEVIAEGNEGDLKDFKNWCYNGVGSAIVQKIEASWAEATGEFSDFKIEY